jgi:Glycosyltransferase
MTLRIAILGTRGIPNHYGGFEQFAQYLSAGLAARGHDVFVYNSHNHPYRQNTWKNVQIIHCFDPEKQLGSFGQFIYDFNCIRDARKRKFDVILMLGFTSSSAWGWFYPKHSTLIFNMDGLEWKRAKYSRPVQKFLLLAEKLAVRFTRHYVADSVVIQSYLNHKYAIKSEHIPYGAEIYRHEDERLLAAFGVRKYDYFILIARMVPENNIQMILDGFHASRSNKRFLVISPTHNKLGRYLKNRYRNDLRIVFTGTIYNNPCAMHTLRIFSCLYFHGHSVGGTNPSLLEAMASQALVAAHDNPFNRSVLQHDALYFSSAEDVTLIIDRCNRNGLEAVMIENNLRKIQEQFCWERIIQQYDDYIEHCVQQTTQAQTGPSTVAGL